MRAIDRTTGLFVAAVKSAFPSAHLQVERSVTAHGRSTYVIIYDVRRFGPIKVRISDHPVGMRRAKSGTEDLYLHARARADHWSVWLAELVKRHSAPDGAALLDRPTVEVQNGLTPAVR